MVQAKMAEMYVPFSLQVLYRFTRSFSQVAAVRLWTWRLVLLVDGVRHVTVLLHGWKTSLPISFKKFVPREGLFS